MPVRSLNSSVLKWPNREVVDAAFRQWASVQRARHPELAGLGYFGSYARGDWGVGSDLDIVAIVSTAAEPFQRRPLRWDLTALPVPAEMLVYTIEEWECLQAQGRPFARTIANETIWIYSDDLVH